jgi:hypothetical protein
VKVNLKWTSGIGVRDLTKRADLLGRAGVYLWVFQGSPKRVAYVGETGDFQRRMLEHCQALTGGRYWLGKCDTRGDYLDQLKSWFFADQGLRTYEDLASDEDFYIPESEDRVDFKRAFLDRDVAEMRRSFLESLRFAFAEIPGDDATVRRDVEGLFLDQLRSVYAKQMGISESQFRMPGSSGADTLLGRITRYCRNTYEIVHECDESQVPEEVSSIVSSG